MKTTVKFNIVLLFFSAQTYSQNYSCVIPNQQQFFELDVLNGLQNQNATVWSTIKVMYFDSVATNGNGNSRFSFHSFRDTVNTSSLPCLDINGPAWSGYKMQEMNNGMNIFFNYQNDSIRINTLASINDSWHFYDSINGAFYLATVDSIVWLQMAGISDSVKCISLMAYDSLGNIKSGDPANGVTMYLSKSNGFFRTIAFREFPSYLVYTLNRRDPIQMPTNAQMFDFDVNDEFEYSLGCTIPFQSSPPPAFLYQKIISKTISYTPDTIVTYQRQNIELAYIFNPIPVPHMDSTISNWTDQIIYDYSSKPFCSKLPEEMDTTTLINYTLAQDTTFNSLPQYTFGSGNMFHQPGDSCYFTNHFEPVFYTSTYAAGLGVIDTISNQISQVGPYCRSGLLWYHKGTVSYGNYVYITTGINELKNTSTIISLYPNPNNGIFTLEFSKSISSASTIEILNLLGEVVYKDEIKSGQNKKEIHLTNFSSGFYTCRIISNENATQKKFVVR